MKLEVAGRVVMLRPNGSDIADPFGGDLETYRSVREEIRAAVLSRIAEMTALV